MQDAQDAKACPICGYRPLAIVPKAGYPTIPCPRCGDFTLIAQAYDLPHAWQRALHPDRPPRGRFAVSHAIRRMQSAGNKPPEINADRLKLLWAQPLPNPQRQADLLVLALGDAALPADEFVQWRVERFCAEMGTQDDPTLARTGGFLYVATRLIEHKLIEAETSPPSPLVGYRLSFDGWAAYERLRREVVDSKTAFMAMSFSNPELDKIVAEQFVPAVKETGFELYRLNDRPKAGLIDNRMRVEIRTAKFLVCDLTDENRGAYWEAGFAEGAQKPVFYTCEKTKFDNAKSHFDTEHMFTVLWQDSDPGKAAGELQAAIRNEFPADAIPPDLSKMKTSGGR